MVALAYAPSLAALALPVAAGGTQWKAYFEFLGVFHPAVSHFPIALLAVAGLIEAWSIVRRHKKPSEATLVCLAIGTFSAVAATVLGWADADRMGYGSGETINWHRWLGVAVTVLSVLSVVLAAVVLRANVGRKVVWSYRSTVLVTAALVGYVGSLGGKLVHGKSYYDDALAELREQTQKTVEVAQDVAEDGVDAAKNVVGQAAAAVQSVSAVVAQPPAAPTTGTAPTTNPVAAGPTTAPAATTQPAAGGATVLPAALPGGRVDYARDIVPIFEAECNKCHNAEKDKGDYRMDTVQHLFTAGETGEAPIVAGRSGDSLLVKLIEGKGEYEDSIMPPKGDPLTPDQIALIRRWIDEGAQAPTPQ